MAADLLTPELVEKIGSFIAVGASVTDTAGAAGVGRSTLYRWLKEGAEAQRLRDEGHTNYDQLLLRLHEEVDKATHEAKVEALMALRKGFRGWTETETTTVTLNGKEERTTVKTRTRFAWEAALAYLERKHPTEFARLIRQEISGPEGGPIPVEQRALALATEIEEFLAKRDADVV